LKRQSKIISLLILFLSVLLLSLSQPSFFFEDGCSFLAWFAYIPVFILSGRLSLKISILYGFAYGFLSAFSMFFWLSSFGIIAVFFVALIYAFYGSLLFLVLSFFEKKIPCKYSKILWIVRAATVLSMDFLRTKGVFAFSYGIIGYSQWKNPVLLSFSSFFGVWGVSFFILLVNSAFASAFSSGGFSENYRSAFKKILFCLSFYLSLSLYYFFSVFSEKSDSYDELPVLLIQNSSCATSNSISDYERDLLTLIDLTEQGLKEFPDVELVVWPETAVVPDILYNLENKSDFRRHKLSETAVDFFRQQNSAFLIGNNHRDSSGVHNSAVYFPKESEEISVYDKNFLVPFTEYWPSFLNFKFLDSLKNYLNCEFFAPGSIINIFEIKNHSFASPICFEDSFSPLLRKMKKSGCDFFVNISDDAWAKSSAEKNMHLSMSVFRAAELASPFLRSTIDGRTCAIDSHGKILAQIQEEKDGWLYFKLKLSERKNTPYAFWGDFFVIVILFFMLILLLILSAGFVKVKCYGRR